MIDGVSKGFKYTMKYDCKRLPLQPVVDESKKVLKIISFLGRKEDIVINALDGVYFELPDEEENLK